MAVGGAALDSYGSILAAAKKAVADSAARWQTEQSHVETLRRRPEFGQDPELDRQVADAVGRQRRALADADEARRELTTAARRSADVLESAAAVRVADAPSLSPDQILQKALGAWGDIVRGAKSAHDYYVGFKNVSDPLLAVPGLLDGAQQAVVARAILRAWRAQREAKELLRMTENLENAKVVSALRTANNDPTDYRVLRQFFEAEEIVDEYKQAALAADGALSTTRNTLVESVKLTTKFAKVAGVLGVIGGGYDLVNPSHEGWRGAGDRAAGAAAVAGGGATLLAAAGLIAPLGPVGAGVAAALLLGSAAWTLGNYVADHWDDIKHGVSVAAHWVGEKAEQAWKGATSEVAEEWNGTVDAGKAVVAGVADVGGSVVSGAKDVGSKAWGGVKGMFG